MYNIKILIKKLESTELNIIDALMLITYAIDSITEMSYDCDAMDYLIESTIKFVEKVDIGPDTDFNKHHRRWVKPRKIDSNADTQCAIDFKTFCKIRFEEIVLSTDHYKKYMLIVEPLINIFKILRNNKLSNDDQNNAINIFPPGCSKSKINDYNDVLAELDMLYYFINNLTFL